METREKLGLPLPHTSVIVNGPDLGRDGHKNKSCYYALQSSQKVSKYMYTHGVKIPNSRSALGLRVVSYWESVNEPNL